MDTSERYIEMCRAAEEIQKTWTPELGDMIHNYDSDRTAGLNEISLPAGLIFAARMAAGIRQDPPVVWLPRQDQLQDMVRCGDDCHDFMLLMDEFYEYSVSVDSEEPFLNRSVSRYCSSMEQLWLAYAMARTHEKWWDGSEWLPINASLSAHAIFASIDTRTMEFFAAKMSPKYMIMNQRVFGTVKPDMDEETGTVYGMKVVIDTHLSDDEIQVMGEPRSCGKPVIATLQEHNTPLLSQIPQMKTNFESGGMQATDIAMNSKTHLKLLCEKFLLYARDPELHGTITVHGLCVRTDNTLEDNVMQILGSPRKKVSVSLIEWMTRFCCAQDGRVQMWGASPLSGAMSEKHGKHGNGVERDLIDTTPLITRILNAHAKVDKRAVRLTLMNSKMREKLSAEMHGGGSPSPLPVITIASLLLVANEDVPEGEIIVVRGLGSWETI